MFKNRRRELVALQFAGVGDNRLAILNDSDMQEGPALGVAQLGAVMAAVEQDGDRLDSVRERGHMYGKRFIPVWLIRR